MFADYRLSMFVDSVLIEAHSSENMLNNGSVLWSAHLLEHESVHFVDWSDSVASWGPSTLWTV